MQLLKTVYTIETSERNKRTRVLRGCRGEMAVGTSEAQVDNVDSCALAVSTRDGFDTNCALTRSRSCIVVPPAIVAGISTIVNCKLHGLVRDTGIKLLLHFDSKVLLDKELTKEEIRQGETTIQIPALEEGIASFILLGEQEDEVVMILHTVSCCVFPSLVTQDINKMLNVMITNSKEDDYHVSYVDLPAADQARHLWIWTDHFCKFLGDVELLFEWMESSQDKAGVVMEVFVNVLQHCCFYEAWHFGAFLLKKAQDCGLQILSNQIPTNGPISAEELKRVTSGDQENNN
eukprot:g5604.t1